MALATTASALVFTSSGFIVWDLYRFEDDIERDLNTQAKLVADLSAPAVRFSQDRNETLDATRA
jgi:hypothetical protein